MDKKYWVFGIVMVLVIAVFGISLASSKKDSFGDFASSSPFSKCSDSDGGLNYNIYGEVTKGTSVYMDACSEITLSEKYCKGNNPSSKNYNCPLACYNGACCTPKTCSELGKQCGGWDNGCGGTLNCGTCASGQTCDSTGQCVASCIPESDSAFCSRLGKNCAIVSANDNCGGARMVNCGTCQIGQVCSNNVCVVSNTTCFDSDGGIVFNAKGTVTKGLSSVIDYCSGNYVGEFYCLNNNIANINASCVAMNYTGCTDGACV